MECRIWHINIHILCSDIESNKKVHVQRSKGIQLRVDAIKCVSFLIHACIRHAYMYAYMFVYTLKSKKH